MKIWSKQNLTGAGALVVSLMLANFLNFVFNAFLGRHLSYEQFGVLTFFNTIITLFSVFFSGLSSTVNHRTAYLNGKYDHEAGARFARFVRRRSALIAIGLGVVWLAVTPLLSKLFHIDDLVGISMFSPVFLFISISMVNRGYLQGNLNFVSVALIILTEAFMKLMSAAALIFLGLENWIYLSIPFSWLTSFALSAFVTVNRMKAVKGENQFRFSKRFYAAAVVTGLSSMVFLSVDVLLAKHFLSPTAAGEYSLLSLIGKMVYFLGSLLNGFIITFVSHDKGEKRDPGRTFNRLFAACLGLTGVAVFIVGVLGDTTAPILLGQKAQAILPYILTYSIAIGVFTLTSAIVIYQLAREQYAFSIAALAVSGMMALGIILNHGGIQEIINAIFWVSLAGFAIIGLMHLLLRNGRSIIINALDLLNVFMPLQTQAELKQGGKRILIMNWRDTKHTFGGGAEVYIHELAKRWVQDGNQVTVFCGNDSKSLHDETIDGVRIVRRGGFYFVYAWAFVYYITRFRGQFDIIIDCQNGIPFFTPLYAKEKIYCLLFHVHQDVFFKYLPGPMAWFASVLENRAMPYFYRNVKFLTISESTKKDMENLSLIGKGIEIIFPGVDLEQMQPGQKDSNPSVLYLGRLKAYKSVDVLIRSFTSISRKVKNSKLLIAGTGEEEDKLKELADELGLENHVEFLGKVTEAQKVQLMQRAWVFVNPSMMEGWGITTIEANACGTPVVAADVPGLRDSVNNPHTGFLVPHGDSTAMAEKISKILADQKLRSFMSSEAIAWSKQFDWDQSAKKGLRTMRLT
jgi:glycosyltransferase involved in cell wall biosynthesis/O-antigen/teichoic acid export membrane protein